MRRFDFYQAHLDAVSRSFALCIPQLPAPFREQVALSSLLLRVLDTIDRMAEGMALYAKRPVGVRLVDLEDVVRYCCIVAGLVGELLTRLWALEGDAPPKILDAYHFGLFLQKVNILKDQAEDEAAGRFFVPDRRELLSSLRADADGALEYLTRLPRQARGYRTFCAWSLMLGAA